MLPLFERAAGPASEKEGQIVVVVPVAVADAASTASLTDCVIDDTRAEVASGGAGFGLVVTRGARAQVTRVAVQRSLVTGVSVDGLGTGLEATDLTVLDTRGLDGEAVTRVARTVGAGRVLHAPFRHDEAARWSGLDHGTD